MTGLQKDLLDPDKIKENLNTRRIGKRILVYNSTISTNDIAAEYAKNKQNDGLVIFTEQQTKGRGRTGSKWLSGYADSILCSIVLTDYKFNPELLSLTAAVAVADGLGKIGPHEAQLKWPNDILLNDRKVAGILLEAKTNKNSVDYIIGIGINCHQTRDSFPPELQDTATSIDIESQTISDRISLAKRLLTSIDNWLEIVEKQNKEVVQKWCQLSTQLGRRVSLIFNGKKFTGNCIGIDPEKGISIQLDTGGVSFFPAAHSTIAKV